MKHEAILAGTDWPPRDTRIDAPDHVALFTYDNGAFVVENFRDDSARVTVSLASAGPLTEVTGNTRPAVGADARNKGRSTFSVVIPAHSFRVYRPAR